MTFRVGQRVVCIDGRRNGGVGDETYPMKGKVYTVRGFLNLHDGASPRIWLCEITNKPRLYYEGCHEKAFGVERFRPVAERKTDISIFTKMLTPEGVDA